MEINTIGYPVIKLGNGLVVVGEGHLDNIPALTLTLNGTGVVGDSITAPGEVPHNEVLAVITFDNIESLDVFISVANRLRDKMLRNSAITIPPINEV